MSQIHFRILPPISQPDEPIFVLGSHAALGSWNPQAGLRLTWEAPFHVGTLEAETGEHLEYKITRGSWETEAVDAYGNVPSNQAAEVWLDATLHHTIADWKDRCAGRLTRDRVASRILAGGRDLVIWLPPGYGVRSDHRFPLAIFSDGANVFDPATSVLSGVDIAADEWVTRLFAEGTLPEMVVVGVCHPEGFSEENYSLRDYDLSPELGGAAYAEFVATELIPYLDTHYRTVPSASARLLAGTSLGGLNAFYTVLHHPGTFGNVIGLSTSFEDVSQVPPAYCAHLHALAAEPALPAGLRMFFDYGTVGLDECYDGYHRDLAGLFREKGWREGEQFQIKQIPGGTHDEISWRQRLGDGLRFIAANLPQS